MRRNLGKKLALLGALTVLLSIARPVDAQVLVRAFGGITKAGTKDGVVAGSIGGKAGPVEVDAEAGWMRNIVPKFIHDDTRARTGYTLSAKLRAKYLMGNVRLIAKSGLIQPFVHAGAGIGRLKPEFTASDPRVTLMSQFGESGETTKFLAGAGGGVRIQIQKAVLDGGYRYMRVFHNYRNDSNLGNDEVLVNVHMFYVGCGFRF